jgi:hypothetical protein
LRGKIRGEGQRRKGSRGIIQRAKSWSVMKKSKLGGEMEVGRNNWKSASELKMKSASHNLVMGKLAKIHSKIILLDSSQITSPSNKREFSTF